MSIEVDRDALAIALRHVSSVVEARTTIPVLANILIEAADGRVTVHGTDLDRMASASCPAAGDLSTTVSADKLVAAVDSHRPGRLTIAPVAGRQAVTVKQGRSVRTLPTLPATDFPRRKREAGDTMFSIAGPALLRLLDACHVAQSTDETRYYLGGIFLHAQDGKLRAAATDGYRLIRAETALPDGAAGMADAIVPTKMVTMLRRLLAKATANVAITLSARAIRAEIGDVAIDSNLIEGTFPDYTRVIPPVGETRMTVPRSSFVHAVQATASVVAAEGGKIKSRGVALDLTGSDGPEVHAVDTSGSSASEPLDGEVAGPKLRIGVNSAYARAVAEIFATDATLTITSGGDKHPLRITSDKDADIVALVMPMQI